MEGGARAKKLVGICNNAHAQGLFSNISTSSGHTSLNALNAAFSSLHSLLDRQSMLGLTSDVPKCPLDPTTDHQDVQEGSYCSGMLFNSMNDWTLLLLLLKEFDSNNSDAVGDGLSRHRQLNEVGLGF